MNKWIPVTEKLPTKEGLYIVTMDGGNSWTKRAVHKHWLF